MPLGLIASPEDTDDQIAQLIQHIDIHYDDDTHEAQNGPHNPTARQDEQQLVDMPISLAESVEERHYIPALPVNAKETSENSQPHATQGLLREVNTILDRIFEIEELRHTSQGVTDTKELVVRVEPIIISISSSLASLKASIDSLRQDISDYKGDASSPLSAELEDLEGEYKKADDKQRRLKLEIKENEWLQEFKTSADQADALMEPLQQSLATCQQFLERLRRSRNPIPDKSYFKGQLSAEGFQHIVSDHDSLVITARTMKKLDKDLHERRIDNGAVLRRFNDLSQKWSCIQYQLTELEKQFQVAGRHIGLREEISSAGMEVLTDETSSAQQSEVDNRHPPCSADGKIVTHPATPSRVSPISSISFGRSPGKPQAVKLSHINDSSKVGIRRSFDSQPPATLNSTITAGNLSEKPRWNSSPKAFGVKTPTAGHARSPAYASHPLSPTPSNTSLTSTSSRVHTRTSSHKNQNVGSAYGLVSPRGEVSGVNNTHNSRLSLPGTLSSSNKGQSHLEHARMGLKTPESGRPRLSGTFSALQPRLSSGMSASTPSDRQYSRTTLNAAHVSRPGHSRPPPSSFNPPSFTPRSSSRLSTASYSNFDHSVLTPFRPSHWDELDKDVHRIIVEEGFQNYFTARVDMPLKKGQRMAEGEDWKGEFVFGAGRKPTPVKRIELSGRKPGLEKRVKVMVKEGGRWIELAELLKDRKDMIELLSP
ncbi:hypothetical protein I307_00815 [Cryptococcus deuterogattii 99/473]|uniref:GAR domain-containing protein n=1 Tax=Cryptococcus deuterogattii Ram5 TaxID=1296110 RepID=A0A0D0T8K5_9TREE|nr:hypothetical protein I313_01561 [Cryptococcus deuterogattii Ram5]KIY59741.1 hypothetical protein I307_00815 [Cryptococcus deuterogattii 99/473]